MRFLLPFIFIFPILTFKKEIINILNRNPNSKLCVDCQHFIPDKWDGQYGRCYLFPKIEDNDSFLVNGLRKDIIIEYRYCSTARKYQDMCGEIGKLYKEKI